MKLLQRCMVKSTIGSCGSTLLCVSGVGMPKSVLAFWKHMMKNYSQRDRCRTWLVQFFMFEGPSLTKHKRSGAAKKIEE